MLYSKTTHYLSQTETNMLLEFLRREFGLINIASITAKPNELTEIETIDNYKIEHSVERFKKFVEEYNDKYEGKQNNQN